MTKDHLVVLDACALVGGGLRDTLLRLAETPRLYVPKWSDDIICETIRTLQGPRFNKTKEQTEHLKSQLKKSFPEAWVTGYKELEPSLTNDPQDRHVLAAAIRSGAQTIVTFNRKHFQAAALSRYDIDVAHPDEFLVSQFHLDQAIVALRFNEQATDIGRTVEQQLLVFHKT